MNSQSISFIGGGNMAQSLITGLVEAGHDAGHLTASDPIAAQRKAIGGLGATAVEDNQHAITGANVVVLAVKPQVLGAVLKKLAFEPDQLIISICAGVPIASIAGWTSEEQPIVRCMPNIPALLRAGITALHANPQTDPKQREIAEQVLAAVGQTIWVDAEATLDAVTAISGSGPAYFFYLMEAMVRAGEALGLEPEVASQLTIETAYGAARMARETSTPPATLRVNVTSPGGTTERALKVLDEYHTDQHIVDAIKQAAQRAHELAIEFGQS